jgi:hypothetical protein
VSPTLVLLRRERLDRAIKRLASLVAGGHLAAVTDPAALLHAVADELEAARTDRESWRTAALAWQRWGADLLATLGLQPPGGLHGDGPARDIIAALARTAREMARS